MDEWKHFITAVSMVTADGLNLVKCSSKSHNLLFIYKMRAGYSNSVGGGRSNSIFQNLIYLVRDWVDDKQLGVKRGYFEQLVSM